jgi:hypothetical protein
MHPKQKCHGDRLEIKQFLRLREHTLSTSMCACFIEKILGVRTRDVTSQKCKQASNRTKNFIGSKYFFCYFTPPTHKGFFHEEPITNSVCIFVGGLQQRFSQPECI